MTREQAVAPKKATSYYCRVGIDYFPLDEEEEESRNSLLFVLSITQPVLETTHLFVLLRSEYLLIQCSVEVV